MPSGCSRNWLYPGERLTQQPTNKCFLLVCKNSDRYVTHVALARTFFDCSRQRAFSSSARVSACQYRASQASAAALQRRVTTTHRAEGPATRHQSCAAYSRSRSQLEAFANLHLPACQAALLPSGKVTSPSPSVVCTACDDGTVRFVIPTSSFATALAGCTAALPG